MAAGGFCKLPTGSVVVALNLPRPAADCTGCVRVLVHAQNRARALTRLRNLGMRAVYLRGNAAPPTLAYMPSVRNGMASATTAQIYACQCGAVIALALDDSHVLLTIQDHSRGGATIVGIDDGRTFTEMRTQPAFPGHPFPTPGAAFDFPGIKQGVGSTVVAFGGYVTYAPSRMLPDDRYNIWRFVYQP